MTPPSRSGRVVECLDEGRRDEVGSSAAVADDKRCCCRGLGSANWLRSSQTSPALDSLPCVDDVEDDDDDAWWWNASSCLMASLSLDGTSCGADAPAIEGCGCFLTGIATLQWMSRWNETVCAWRATNEVEPAGSARGGRCSEWDGSMRASASGDAFELPVLAR